MGVLMSSGDSGSGLRFTFEEVWRFLYHYGMVFLEVDGRVVEVRTGFTKTDRGLGKVVRFLVGEDEVARVCDRCWGMDVSCDGVGIKGLSDSLIRYIENAYVE